MDRRRLVHNQNQDGCSRHVSTRHPPQALRQAHGRREHVGVARNLHLRRRWWRRARLCATGLVDPFASPAPGSFDVTSVGAKAGRGRPVGGSGNPLEQHPTAGINRSDLVSR